MNYNVPVSLPLFPTRPPQLLLHLLVLVQQPLHVLLDLGLQELPPFDLFFFQLQLGLQALLLALPPFNDAFQALQGLLLRFLFLLQKDRLLLHVQFESGEQLALLMGALQFGRL